MTATPVVDQAPQGSYVQRVLRDATKNSGALCAGLSILNIQYVAWERDVDAKLLAAVSGYLGADSSRTSAALGEAGCLRRVEASDSINLYRDVEWKPDLVEIARHESGTGIPADYTLGSDDRISIKAVDPGYRYLILNQPSDPNWRLDGEAPIAGTNNTVVFRLENGDRHTLTLVNRVTSMMYILLYLTLALCAIVLLWTYCPWNKLIRGRGHLIEHRKWAVRALRNTTKPSS
jgi:hypothetical protein